MAALSKLKRLARLSGWLSLGLVSMLLAACGALFSSACKQPPTVGVNDKPDARPDAADDTPRLVLPNPDAAPTGEVASPVDASEEDLWNVPCE
jgi:hypothetical protein